MLWGITKQWDQALEKSKPNKAKTRNTPELWNFM
jgi:hypothetical protein